MQRWSRALPGRPRLSSRRAAAKCVVGWPAIASTRLQGEGVLTFHQWNTRRAKHYFCSRYGIYTFHRKRAASDHFGVNLFCLEEFDVSSVPVRATEGANGIAFSRRRSDARVASGAEAGAKTLFRLATINP